MKTTKYFIAIMFVVILLFLIPTISNAAEQTYTDVDQNIEWGYELDGSENVINLRCKTTGVTGSVTIPSTIEGKNVISLAGEYGFSNRGAFKDCNGLQSITIPETVKVIGKSAFDNCTGLTSVKIPNSVTSIENYAFNNCSGLSSVTFSNTLTTIGTDAFNGCSGLSTITLPNTLTTIGNRAFESCTGLRTLVIPDSVTTIGSRAFNDCSGLRDVTLSTSLSKLDHSVFGNCSGLTSIIIPNSVTTILGSTVLEDGAFKGCTGLRKVLIPDSVVTIEENAFQGCSKLTIYGNNDATSKEYAEAHEIPFDYIENWDKESSGSDITAPTVESIYVTYSSVMSYWASSNNMYMVPTDAKLVINVRFSETVKGTAVPTLTIKFGNGNNIDVTEGTIGGSTITYIYTIKATDEGTMTTVNLTGGNVTDEAGNAATLSCPKLSVEYSSFNLVYANGTATNPTNPSTGGNTAGGNTTGGGSTTGGNTSGGNKTTGNTAKDNTTYNGKLPQTGVEAGIVFILLILIATGIFAYFKYRNLKNI